MNERLQPIHPVTLIGGGPGAWDLITVRGMHRLQEAEVILADHLGPTAELSKLVDVSTKHIIDVSKLPYGKQVAQERINELLIEHALAGKKVARLKGGDPYIFGRGFEELQACAEAGVPCEVVPGVTSAVSVPALAGVPVTQRGVVHNFTVISGHLPPGHEKSLNDWEALARTGGTLSVIMGVKNAPKIATALLEAGRDADTPVVVIQEGSTEAERVVRCTLGTLGATMQEHEIKPPAVYVIGEVAGL
ncbi:uroporphyrinogen-III C-methyltransferase [Corynebacterium pseudopelargi]|uniref:uroporphyrinogen-III C-methyltransferase n=1 Tax=Corynebacterium pseudopelargi TaxID=2080757 RepID=A0A3G6ITI7_9CORY|nr:uroporphyrinogen-III C-methyltransferase [Corynebacterium pseudopelargi]AZA09035.1 Uroporphyrinogen-III C-methyltransferase [Corynebacterium pseudopelargi]